MRCNFIENHNKKWNLSLKLQINFNQLIIKDYHIMLKKNILTSALILFFINASAFSWDPIVEMDNNIFPSYIIATANSSQTNYRHFPVNIDFTGDHSGILGIKITGIAENTSIKLELSENDIFYTSSIKKEISHYLDFQKPQD